MDEVSNKTFVADPSKWFTTPLSPDYLTGANCANRLPCGYCRITGMMCMARGWSVTTTWNGTSSNMTTTGIKGETDCTVCTETLG